MTQQSSTAPKIAYFNAHTEGLGYLDNLVEVKPKAGQDFTPFWTATFCMLEGDPKNPEKLYVALTVPGSDVIAVLKPYCQDINNNTTKVFVGLRLAKLRGTPFVYGANSQTPGQLGINYAARLIKVMCLKVGDNVIKLNSENDPVKQITPVPVVSHNGPVCQAKAGLFDVPLIVTLSTTDANFVAEKTRLSSLGYGWHADLIAWVKREVSVAFGDRRALEKSQFLESNGYVFNPDDAVWHMTFSKSKPNTGDSRSTQQSANSH